MNLKCYLNHVYYPWGDVALYFLVCFSGSLSNITYMKFFCKTSRCFKVLQVTLWVWSAGLWIQYLFWITATQLLTEGYLKEKAIVGSFGSTFELSPKAHSWLSRNDKFEIVPNQKLQHEDRFKALREQQIQSVKDGKTNGISMATTATERKWVLYGSNINFLSLNNALMTRFLFTLFWTDYQARFLCTHS